MKLQLALLSTLAAMVPMAQASAMATAQVRTAAAATVALASPERLTREMAPPLRVVTAAGSLLILAEGIVANARFAQVQPPAPGFVYD
jgi:hypothetical protein